MHQTDPLLSACAPHVGPPKARTRTLRWVIESKTTPRAEVEIRKVFGKVAEIMAREAPSLFGDFTAIPVPDGACQ
jgi:thymidylate synthase (FAD)